MKLSALKINADAVENGAWINEIPELGGLRLKVRGAGNSDFRRMQSKLIETVPRGERTRGMIDPETMDTIQAKCLAHTVLQDWDGLTEDDGVTPIPFSKEKALEMLLDKSLRPFRDGVAYAASIVSHVESENREAVEGNFEAS